MQAELSAHPLKELLRRVFTEVIASPTYNEALIDRYFDPAYQQTIDGNRLNLADFKKHVKLQKTAVQNCRIDFIHMLAEGDMVSSVHKVSAQRSDGSTIIVKAMAIFQARNGRLLSCDELTHVLA